MSDTIQVSVELIKEAYSAANSIMKVKMLEEFPELLRCKSAFIRELPRYDDNLVLFCERAFGSKDAIQITDAAGPSEYRGKALYVHHNYEVELLKSDGGKSTVILIKNKK